MDTISFELDVVAHYLDHVVFSGRTETEHNDRLYKVFERIQAYERSLQNRGRFKNATTHNLTVI